MLQILINNLNLMQNRMQLEGQLVLENQSL